MPRTSTSKIIRAALLATLFVCVFTLSSGATLVSSYPAYDADQKKEFAKCWEHKTDADISVRSESDASNIYFVDIERRLIAVDLITGSTVWSTELGGDAVSDLLVTNDSVIVATTRSETAAGSDTLLRSVSKQTGITSWFVKMVNSQTLKIGGANGTVIVVTPSGTASAYATTTGEAKWSKSVGAIITTAPFFSGSSMFVGTDRNEVIAIAASSGDIAVAAKTESVPAVIFSDLSGHVLVGDDRGNLSLASTDGKRVWNFRNGARISGISMYDSEFLVTSNDNFVYKLSRGGNVEWKRRLSSRIEGRPLVLGNVAVFATVGDGIVYVVDLTNGKILNRFENGENNAAQAVAAGNSFVMVTKDGLTLFTRGACPSSKKTVP